MMNSTEEGGSAGCRPAFVATLFEVMQCTSLSRSCMEYCRCHARAWNVVGQQFHDVRSKTQLQQSAKQKVCVTNRVGVVAGASLRRTERASQGVPPAWPRATVAKHHLAHLSKQVPRKSRGDHGEDAVAVAAVEKMQILSEAISTEDTLLGAVVWPTMHASGLHAVSRCFIPNRS